MHIWWARRPLASCRAVICGGLWPDPVDELCPRAFVDGAKKLMLFVAQDCLGHLSEESFIRFNRIARSPNSIDDPVELRNALLDFIADFSDWERSVDPSFVVVARTLTHMAHNSLRGSDELCLPTKLSLTSLSDVIANSTHPILADSFAGGGAIPLEGLRCGTETIASDLNPLPLLLNTVIGEYIPRFGVDLACAVRRWGNDLQERARKELEPFYPGESGESPIAYLWARKVICDGPGCGAEVPMLRSPLLATKGSRLFALQLIPERHRKRICVTVVQRVKGTWVRADAPSDAVESPSLDGTVKRGSVTCPCCGYTTPVARVREQMKSCRGGANDAVLLCVVSTRRCETGRHYRVPSEADTQAFADASQRLSMKMQQHKGVLSLVPNERLDIKGIRHTWAMIYGVEEWGDCFNSRQALALVTLQRLAEEMRVARVVDDSSDLADAVHTCGALIIDKLAQYNSSMCRWKATGENLVDTFGRQALPMVWDYAEANPFAGASGDFLSLVKWHADALEHTAKMMTGVRGTAIQASATVHPYPDDSVDAFVTDPPYYDSVPYSFLSDFFYVWLRRALVNTHPNLFAENLVPKDSEIVVDRPHELSDSTHDIDYYERELAKAFAEGRRILRSDGIGVIVFASKTTASWEAILKAVVDAGWTVTGSWPIDTEMATRVAAQGQARLASSVHLICRPRVDENGLPRVNVGEWRDVLTELPLRISAWLPRLAAEGVVGADAIFACLGPALEIFSRYSSVEKTSGEKVELREYLEQVWAEVAKQALNMIFEGADTAGLEEDARLTAMWLWTLRTDAEADVDAAEKVERISGYELEYDAARKIAQGLGCHLDTLAHLVQIKGENATLLSAASRARYLFGKEEVNMPKKRGKAKPVQGDLFAALDLPSDEDIGREQAELDRPAAGKTTLDQLHQAMILFGAGRGAALKRFLVDDGVGANAQLWSLAQSLTALYPPQSEEKRWVDGVLARKKGLGF
jgi:putative DNA methylase